MPESAIPAGWYPDPAGSFQQRWWDGTAWTNDFAQYRPTLVHSAPAAEALQARAAAISGVSFGQQQNASVTHFASGQVSAEAAERARQNNLIQQAQQTQTIEPGATAAGFDPLPSFNVPAEDRAPLTSVAQPNAGNATLIAVSSQSAKSNIPAVNPSFAADYQPFGLVSEVRHGQKEAPEHRYTASALVLALLPAIVVGVAFVIATFLPVIYTTFVQAIVLALSVGMIVALAVRDRFVLRLAGHDRPASPVWILLTPIAYLSARTAAVTRETGRSAALPLVILLVVLVAIGAAVVLVPGLSTTLLTPNALY